MAANPQAEEWSLIQIFCQCAVKTTTPWNLFQGAVCLPKIRGAVPTGLWVDLASGDYGHLHVWFVSARGGQCSDVEEHEA